MNDELDAARARFTTWDERNTAARMFGKFEPITTQISLDALTLARAFVARSEPKPKKKRESVAEAAEKTES